MNAPVADRRSSFHRRVDTAKTSDRKPQQVLGVGDIGEVLAITAQIAQFGRAKINALRL